MKVPIPLLDEYNRRARLVPGLLFVLPVPVVIVALGLRQNPVVAMLASLIPVVGGPVALADYVRQRGLKVQEALYAAWGGSPTTAALRYRGNASQVDERARLRSHLVEKLKMTLPSEAEEAADPDKADAAYETAMSRLRGLTRDKAAFHLLFEENKNYGYARNLLGVRTPAIILGGVAWVVLCATTWLSWKRKIAIPIANPLVGGLALTLLLLFWLIVPSRDRVRRQAGTYAARLIEAAWTLNGRPAKPQGRQKKTSKKKTGSEL